eukprot:scaffold5073_cov47-Attheya_sp.AAC.1
MGCAPSKLPLIENIDGNEAAYHDRFLEDGVLGQGEFGIVKMVHDVKASSGGHGNEPLACKALRKGMVFKDNTLYAPLKAHVLQSECRILRTLAGKCFNMKLVAVYETSSVIYMVTELCAGGEMMHYVSHTMSDGLRTEDVSRIAYQSLTAMDHCAKHRILHRDLKPENIMFTTPLLGSDLRIIDFGSGTMDPPPSSSKHGEEEEDLVEHSTFAGTAFYISPEVFQKKYTSKTDVWSIGVVLYVLVAGFPAAELQKAFNILQSSNANRNLRSLPNLPDNMPDSYYDMLEELLVYRHKKRKTAGQILRDCEFVSFHKRQETKDEEEEETMVAGSLSLEQIAAEAMDHANNDMLSNNLSNASKRTTSVLLSGSVRRHTSYLGYQKFERSITTLLATILSKKEYERLVRQLYKKIAEPQELSEVDHNAEDHDHDHRHHAAKLRVIQVRDLKNILNDLDLGHVVDRMDKLPNASTYETFAYRVTLLRQFTSLDYDALNSARSISSATPGMQRSDRRQLHRSMSFEGKPIAIRGGDPNLDSSLHSLGNHSVQGNNVWDTWKQSNDRKNVVAKANQTNKTERAEMSRQRSSKF